MSQETERAELRALQQKAYGREGGLTDAEAQRLRSLEQAVSATDAASTAPAPAPAAPPPEPAGPTAAERAEPVDAVVSQPDPEASPTEADDARPSSPRRAAAAAALGHWRIVAVAAVVLLAIGIGAGWLLFGLADGSPALTAAQQERRLELTSEGKYDEGSVRIVGQDDEGALVWFGTRDGGAKLCVVLDVDDRFDRRCVPREEATIFALAAEVMLPEESGVTTTVHAYVAMTTSGEPVGAIERWEQDGSPFTARFGSENRARAEEMSLEFETAQLGLIGSFRDEPVWLVGGFVDDLSQTCLIVDAADEQRKCLPPNDALQDGISMLVFVDDGAEGSQAWGIEVAYTVSQVPYLVITRDPQPATITYSEYDLQRQPSPEPTPSG